MYGPEAWQLSTPKPPMWRAELIGLQSTHALASERGASTALCLACHHLQPCKAGSDIGSALTAQGMPGLVNCGNQRVALSSQLCTVLHDGQRGKAVQPCITVVSELGRQTAWQQHAARAEQHYIALQRHELRVVQG